MSKVWLIGLDGASFEILDPMIKAGKLPVIAGLIKDGATAVLKSNVAPSTPQAWASVLTGKNPGKHGVFGFIRQTPGQPPEFLSSKSMKAEKLWTWFGRAGLSSLIVNVPLSYPPEPLNGAMITGMMTPSTASEFTYPSTLKERVLSEFPDYRVDVEAGISYSRNLDILRDLERSMSDQVKLATTLVNETDPDFFFFVFILPDRIQHTYSQFINPTSTAYNSRRAQKWRERIWDSYAKLDQSIGEMLKAAPAGTNVILVSDHGFTMERGAFYTNDFLAHMGLLALKPGPGRGAFRSLIRRLNVSGLKRYLPMGVFPATRNLTKEAIDWSKTKAYASPVPQQGIFINLLDRSSQGIVPMSDYECLRDQIIEAVAGVRDQAGKQLIKAYRREELFSGPYLESIPDIVLSLFDQGLEAKEIILGGDFLTWSNGGSRGRHHRDGIFVAVGPDVRTGRFNELELEDIAPNILALSNAVSIPGDLDGRVRPDIFILNKGPNKVREKSHGLD